MQNIGEVLACPTFEATEKWVDEHVDLFTDGQTPDPYQFSKQCVTASFDMLLSPLTSFQLMLWSMIREQSFKSFTLVQYSFPLIY